MVVKKDKRVLLMDDRMTACKKRRILMKRKKAPISGRRRGITKNTTMGMTKKKVMKRRRRKKISTKRKIFNASRLGVTKRRLRRRKIIPKKRSVIKEERNRENSQRNTHTDHFDQGWAWLVMLGGGLWIFLYAGTLKSFGLLYVVFQEWFQCSPSEASTVGLLFGIIQIIAAPVSGLVADYSKNRVLPVMCGLVASAGIVATSQASNLLTAIICYGIITGVTASVLDVVAFSIVGKYFRKYRNFANSVLSAGGSIGTLAIPQVYAATQEAFNSRTAILTFGGLWLNACVVGALMRPVKMTKIGKESSHDLKDTIKKTGCSHFAERMHSYKENTETMEEDHTLESSSNIDSFTMRNVSEIVDDSSLYNEHNENQMQKVIYDKSNLVISLGKISDSTIKKDFVAYRIDSVVEEDSKTDAQNLSQEEMGYPEQKLGTVSQIQNFWTAIKSYCSLLKNYGLIVRIIALNLSWFASILPIVVFPPLCKELNIDIQRTANLITVSGCVEIPALVIIGLLTDRLGWRPVWVLSVSTSIPAAISVIVIFLPRYDVLMIFSCFHGLLSGRAHAFFNTTLTEAIDISDLGRAMALMLAMNGACAALLTPTVGLVKEASGTHLYVFAVSASAALLGNILYISISCVESKRKDKKPVPP